MNALHPSRGAELNRRDFLRLVGTGALGFSLAGRGWAAAADPSTRKSLRGIFPIAQTPFTAKGDLDLDALVRQLEFIDRGHVHGFVWPQLASEWSTLTERERLDGMEAIGIAARKLRPAVILGVQGADMDAVRRYIKQAERVGAAAIIALPPAETADTKAVVRYYQEIGQSTGLPLFVQAVGNVDVDLLLELYRTIPTMRYVKDEAGDPLVRVGALREKSHDEIKVFSGNHGRKMIEELERGFSGSMPAAGLADLYATTFELWQAGKHEEARASHARTLEALDVMLRYGMEGMKYVLCARQVFNTYSARTPVKAGFAAATKVATGGKGSRALDDEGRKALQALVDSLKPHLRG